MCGQCGEGEVDRSPVIASHGCVDCFTDEFPNGLFSYCYNIIVYIIIVVVVVVIVVFVVCVAVIIFIIINIIDIVITQILSLISRLITLVKNN